MKIRFATAGLHEIQFIEIKQESLTIPWREWVSGFAARMAFKMAWLSDTEYQFWQNAEDPLQYESRGKSHQHLAKRSNGLPAPLTANVIDVTRNPGKVVLCVGYIEAIGSMMWLGEGFWNLGLASKSEVSNASWLQVSHLPYGLVELKCLEHAFMNEHGKEQDLQLRLRQLLFKAGGEPNTSGQEGPR